MLSGNFTDMKTADVVVLEYNGRWKDLQEKSCNQTIYISPKDLI